MIKLRKSRLLKEKKDDFLRSRGVTIEISQERMLVHETKYFIEKLIEIAAQND